jgi:hypothetical protein
MSVFKQFTTQDVTVSPFIVNKFFYYIGSQVTGSNVGIEFYAGINSSSNYSTGLVSEQSASAVYDSVKQLYYSNYLSSSAGDYVATQSLVPGSDPSGNVYVGAVHSPLYDNYMYSTISQSRYFPTASGANISVISVPTKLYGEYIMPDTFKVTYTSSTYPYSKFNITDDGEGNLIANNEVVGQVFYSHGMAIITSSSLATISNDVNTISGALSKVAISYSSSFEILETQYRCTIRENEYGYSLNPSLLSGSTLNTYYDFATGSNFTPYMTTVGLYNDNQDLIAIGKFAQPIPVSRYTDMTLVLNFDF